MRYRIRVGVNCARPGPPLSPILGQLQLKVNDFITEFNRLTTNYVGCDGLILTCRLTKLNQPQKFTLSIRGPTFFSLWYSLDRQTSKTILYDSYYFLHQRWPTPVESRTLFAQLRSSGYKLN